MYMNNIYGLSKLAKIHSFFLPSSQVIEKLYITSQKLS